MSFGRIPTNESKRVTFFKSDQNLDGPRMPHILLNIVFSIDMFYSFSLPEHFLSQGVPLAKIDIFTNENLY